MSDISKAEIGYRRYSWGNVDVKCPNCNHVFTVDGSSVKWVKYCSECSGAEIITCQRCRKPQLEHRRVQGRLFCNNPFVGVMLYPGPAYSSYLDEDIPF